MCGLTPTGQRRERSERPLEPSVSQHSSERWATFCFCPLSFIAFWLLHVALISVPPYAGRQTDAPESPDPCKGSPLSSFLERNWDRSAGLPPLQLVPLPPALFHYRWPPTQGEKQGDERDCGHGNRPL